MPVDYTALAEQARQSTSPTVDYAALAEQARAVGAAPESHVKDDAMEAGKGLIESINPLSAVSGLAHSVAHPIDTLNGIGSDMADYRHKAASDFSKGNYVDALQHGLSGVVPVVGPMASRVLDTAAPPAGEKFDPRAAGRAMGQIASLETTPALAGGAGKLLQKAAVPAAESALGIGKMDRAYGKTPGVAALEETSGIHPATVAESARARLAHLNDELDRLVNASTNTGSLQPARDVIAQRSQTAAAGNSAATPAELSEMSEQLTKPRPGFSGAIDPATGEIAVDQSPANILRMKREFGKDFTKWNPLHPKGETGTARQAYRALDQELDKAVPEAANLNQRTSSLIPVAQRAESTDLNAGVGQRVAHRVAAHTGALAGAGIGFAAGGPVGAAAGLVIPELLSSPTARMAAARGMYGAGKALKRPGTGAAAGAGVALNSSRSPQDDPLDIGDFLQ